MTASELKAIEAIVHRVVQDALVMHLHPRLRLSIPEAARACGITKGRLYEAIKSGELQVGKLGGTGDYGVAPAELRRWAIGASE